MSIFCSALSLVLSGTEVNELLTDIDVLFVRVAIEARELSLFPFDALGLLLSASLLLTSSRFSLTLLAFQLDTLSLFSARLLLLSVLLSAFSSLKRHLLRTLDPLDVLDVCLFYFEVAHAAVERLLQLILLLFELSGALEALLNLRADIRNVVLLQLFGRIKFPLFSFLF